MVAWSSTPTFQAASRQPCSAINTRCGEWGYETESGRRQAAERGREQRSEEEVVVVAAVVVVVARRRGWRVTKRS